MRYVIHPCLVTAAQTNPYACGLKPEDEVLMQAEPGAELVPVLIDWPQVPPEQPRTRWHPVAKEPCGRFG